MGTVQRDVSTKKKKKVGGVGVRARERSEIR